MGKKIVLLLAMAMAMLLPSQVWSQDSPQRPVGLTTRMANATHNGLRKIKHQPARKIDVAATQTDVAAMKAATADKKRNAVEKAKAQVATKTKDKKESAAT